VVIAVVKRDHSHTLHDRRRIDFFSSAIVSVLVSPRAQAARLTLISDLWLAGTGRVSDAAESHSSSAIFNRVRRGNRFSSGKLARFMPANLSNCDREPIATPTRCIYVGYHGFHDAAAPERGAQAVDVGTSDTPQKNALEYLRNLRLRAGRARTLCLLRWRANLVVMKVPESGMPEEAYWESLFDIPLILDRLKIDSSVEHVAELGCGYGTFTLPVARRIRGTAFTFDVEPAMIVRTQVRAAAEGLGNIQAALRDVLATGFGLESRSCDAVLLFNILHFPQPENLVHKAVEVLRPGGRVLAIHWRSDIKTPRGPPLQLRPVPADAERWASAAGLRVTAITELPPWHFGVVLTT
jgi:SAM-dependent methyltransferase